MMDSKEIALHLCALSGPSGAESPAAKAAAELLAPLGETRVDPLGSVTCTLFPGGEGKRHYLLDAHIDEIGLIVTGVTPEGFLQVANIGGVDRRILSAAEVLVHGARALRGVICSTPPHLQGEGERKNLKLEEVLVDIGLSGEEATEAVRPGDRTTFYGPVRELAGGLICGKALDDRAGCAAVIRAAQLLKPKNLACGLTVALTVQEETGGAGARTAGWPFQPTHGIVVDVTFGRTPDAEKHRTFPLGEGPTIVTAPILSGEMSRRLAEVAKEAGIPFHRETEGGQTGTNADAVAVIGAGVATASLGIPQRYMHTPVEVVDPRDIELTARLIAEYIIREEGI